MNKYWPLESRANKTFSRSGSDNTDKCTYTYNEDGYRGDSVTESIDLLAVGCSHTEGIGVNDYETWPFYTANLLGLKHINAGFTGRSNDYIARTVLELVPKYNPKIVSVMYTYPVRREYWTKFGPQPYAGQQWGYFEDYPEKWNAFSELVNLEDNKNNFIKNHSIVRMVCKLAGCKLIWNGTFLNLDLFDDMRFDGEYSIEEGKHATAEQNKNYAQRLVAYMKENRYI